MKLPIHLLLSCTVLTFSYFDYFQITQHLVHMIIKFLRVGHEKFFPEVNQQVTTIVESIKEMDNEFTIWTIRKWWKEHS